MLDNYEHLSCRLTLFLIYFDTVKPLMNIDKNRLRTISDWSRYFASEKFQVSVDVYCVFFLVLNLNEN